jgi:hypothetical protein
VRRIADLEVDIGDTALDTEREELVKRVAIHNAVTGSTGGSVSLNPVPQVLARPRARFRRV